MAAPHLLSSTTTTFRGGLLAPEAQCLYCFSACPPENEFCCRGCAQVYAIVNARSEGAFFNLRTKLGSSVKPQTQLEFSAASDFSYLDSEEYLQNYAGENRTEMEFYLEGVHCSACVWLTEKIPTWIPGVAAIQLNLGTAVATVRLKPGGTFQAVADEFLRLGYRPSPISSGTIEALQKNEARRHLMQLAVAAASAGNIMLLAAAIYAGADGGFVELFRWLSFLLYIPSLVYSAQPFYKGVIGSLRRRYLSIDVPIVLGIAMGTGFSIYNLFTGGVHLYFDSMASLIFLMLSTRYLLRRVNQKALIATSIVQFVAPEKVLRWSGDNTILSGSFNEIDSRGVVVGDVLKILPGAAFPADATILSGTSTVNTALLTGESKPLLSEPGDKVFAGTINLSHPLVVKVLAVASKTRLARIVKQAEDSLMSKAPIVQFLDRVGQYFVVAVVVFAAVGFYLGYRDAGDVVRAIERALAVAIVVCPCTFALATPLAFALAMKQGARDGLIIKDAETIERLAQIQQIYFDKTGTLTTGRLSVVSWEPLHKDAEMILRHLERDSAHPIAVAVRAHFSQLSDGTYDGLLVDEVYGLGVSAKINNATYRVGQLRAVDQTLRRFSDSIAVGVYGADVDAPEQLLGVVEFADAIKSDALEMLTQLRQSGYLVGLISGDDAAAVTSVAGQLGFASGSYFYEVSPEFKATKLRASSLALMVGDGANDSIALASAYVGLAVRGGVELCARSAGVFATTDSLRSIMNMLTVSKETMHVIYRNLVFAVIYNVVVLSVALTGYLTPLIAAVLMPISALSVFLSTIIGTKKLRALRSVNI